MLKPDRLGLNRIIWPAGDLPEFLELASSLGLPRVELRNDLGGRGVIDGYSAGETRELLERFAVQVLTINALQKFNLPERLPDTLAELEELAGLAARLRCPALVLCPNNDPGDRRDPQQRFRDTVSCLKSLAPVFAEAGLLGYVEPLGFGISSLSSIESAARAIGESKAACFRILFDTFHHYLGPDSEETLQRGSAVEQIALVHVSGVEAELEKEQYLDEHRILVGAADRLASREQIRLLDRLGYRGPVCFEPFSSQVQKLSREELIREVGRSIDYLCA